MAHIDLCKACEQKKPYEGSLAKCKKAWELSGGNTEAISLMGHAYAAQGKRTEGQKEVEELGGLSRTKYVPAYNVALICAGLGDKDQALEWFPKGFPGP